MRQVVGNLLSNAVKFTSGGTIDLELSAGPETLQVVVKDSGIGIAPAHLDRIFEPFQQVDGSDRRLYGGTGLGLSISRRLVQLMGGSIHATSEVGEGACFSVGKRVRAPSTTFLLQEGRIGREGGAQAPPRIRMDLQLPLGQFNAAGICNKFVPPVRKPRWCAKY